MRQSSTPPTTHQARGITHHVFPLLLHAPLCTMALPLPSGLMPAEVAFLCEMELITIIPRQKMDSIELLGVRCSPPSSLRVCRVTKR